MATTSIEWTDESTNPIRARHRRTGKMGHYCELYSPGCLHCYASNFQPRFGLPKFPGKRAPQPLAIVDGCIQVNDDIELFMDYGRLKEVISRRKPAKIFWADMTDMFGWWVPDEWIDLCFATMALAPQHTHQVLTKRADRLADYTASRAKSAQFWKDAALRLGHALEWQGVSLVQFPLPNVWLGVSCENQRALDTRLPDLACAKAAVRFISAEPLLGPIDLGAACEPMPDWVIVGGESGRASRPCDIRWVGEIVSQCKNASVPCFVKQLGSLIHARSAIDPIDQFPGDVKFGQGPDELTAWVKLKHSKGGDPSEWPEDLRVRQFPKSS